jgi:hypothetical protein
VAVHIYTQTIHRTTQITTNVEECGLCPGFTSFTLAVALQLREKHKKTSVTVKPRNEIRFEHVLFFDNQKYIYLSFQMPVFNPLVPELNFQCNLQNARYKLQNAKSHKMLSPPTLSPLGKGKVHPCTGTEALYRPYSPYGE